MTSQNIIALCASHLSDAIKFKNFKIMISSWEKQSISCDLYIMMSVDPSIEDSFRKWYENNKIKEGLLHFL